MFAAQIQTSTGSDAGFESMLTSQFYVEGRRIFQNSGTITYSVPWIDSQTMLISFWKLCCTRNTHQYPLLMKSYQSQMDVLVNDCIYVQLISFKNLPALHDSYLCQTRGQTIVNTAQTKGTSTNKNAWINACEGLLVLLRQMLCLQDGFYIVHLLTY